MPNLKVDTTPGAAEEPLVLRHLGGVNVVSGPYLEGGMLFDPIPARVVDADSYLVGGMRFEPVALAPIYRQPQLVTSFGTGSSSTFKLRGQARRRGIWLQVFAWNGVNTTMPVVPAGFTTIEPRTGSSMAGVIAGKFLADGDPISFTFTNATKVLWQAWRVIDPTAPVRGFAGRTQNTAGLTLTYPALARADASRPAVFTRASGIRQTTPTPLLAGWHTDSSTGAGAQNIRWISPDAGPIDGNLSADVTDNFASNIQGISWSLEMLGRTDLLAPVYPWARAPADGSFLAIGDSITYAADPLTNFHEVAFARGINLARNAGYNQGHSGWTSADLKGQGSIVSTYAPSVVVLMCGTNDANPANGPISATDSMANIRFMIDAYNSYGAQVIVGTVLPNTNGREAHRLALNAALREQAASVGDFILWDNNIIGFDPAKHTGDGTHPNAPGADLLGADLWRLLKPIERMAA